MVCASWWFVWTCISHFFVFTLPLSLFLCCCLARFIFARLLASPALSILHIWFFGYDLDGDCIVFLWNDNQFSMPFTVKLLFLSLSLSLAPSNNKLFVVYSTGVVHYAVCYSNIVYMDICFNCQQSKISHFMVWITTSKQKQQWKKYTSHLFDICTILFCLTSEIKKTATTTTNEHLFFVYCTDRCYDSFTLVIVHFNAHSFGCLMHLNFVFVLLFFWRNREVKTWNFTICIYGRSRKILLTIPIGNWWLVAVATTVVVVVSVIKNVLKFATTNN